MYVCICHALNDKKVKAALNNGAMTPASVFRHHDCQVQCGKCVPMLRSMAADHHGARPTSRHAGCQQAAIATASAAAASASAAAAVLEPANAGGLPAYGIAAE